MKKVFVILFFSVLGLLADQVKVSALWGAKGQTFTLLQLFAPAVGAFLGSIGGVAAVAGTEIVSFLIQDKEFTLINVMRLAPLLFATLYFASLTRERGSWSRIIEIGTPVAAIITFLAHPIGREVWFFPAYWLIPIIVAVTPLRKYLLGRSLGATFTAHAVGGAYWIWLTAMPAGLWVGLIPVVAIERMAFGIGIAATYVFVNSLLASLPLITIRSLPIVLHEQYRWHSRVLFRKARLIKKC